MAVLTERNAVDVGCGPQSHYVMLMLPGPGPLITPLPVICPHSVDRICIYSVNGNASNKYLFMSQERINWSIDRFAMIVYR